MNASVKSITDLKMYGLEGPNAIYSIVDLPKGRCLVNIVDTNTNSRTLTKDDLYSMTLRHEHRSDDLISVHVNGYAVVDTGYRGDVSIIEDGDVQASISKPEVICAAPDRLSRIDGCK